MKAPHLLQIVSVTTLFALSLSLSAGETLLSPRANGNQIKTALVADNSANTVAQNKNAIASPRTLDTQNKVAQSGDTSPSTIASGCALGSPRQLEQAGKFTSGNCCKLTSIACANPKSCCTVASN